MMLGCGDVKGDGKSDILWRNSTTGQVYVWELNGISVIGGGSVGAAALDWQIAGIGDVNGDGKADIVWRNNTSGQVYEWQLNGTSVIGGGSLGQVTLDRQIQERGPAPRPRATLRGRRARPIESHSVPAA